MDSRSKCVGVIVVTASGSSDKFDFEYIGPKDLLAWISTHRN